MIGAAVAVVQQLLFDRTFLDQVVANSKKRNEHQAKAEHPPGQVKSQEPGKEQSCVCGSYVCFDYSSNSNREVQSLRNRVSGSNSVQMRWNLARFG